ncbi:hypothetical protein IIC65_08565, partial [Candidatus Sumerlaeota bacterium]|nr:hypothetical protein [Candidatus Sumerlaeota bacterium]
MQATIYRLDRISHVQGGGSMEQAESTLMAERHQLEEALKANSANPATLIKAAQLEARLWAQEP